MAMPKILIAEDEKTIREVYRRYLAREGFTVVEAADGEEASLQLLQHNDLDVVLLDVRMPVVDGATLYDLVRLRHPQAKVIVASVYPLDEQKNYVRDADDYFDKAQGPNALLSKIRSVLTD